MTDWFLMVTSLANLFIAGIFLSLAWGVYQRLKEEGTLIWVDLGKTLLMVGGCLVGQSLVIAAVANLTAEAFRLLWLLVFLLYALTAILIARWGYRTNKMLLSLLGGGEG